MKIENKILRVGVYGILIRDNKILMAKEQSGSRSIYNFPGGGIEYDEGLSDALIRECKEEIGAQIHIKDRLYISSNLYTNPDFPNFCTFNLY